MPPQRRKRLKRGGLAVLGAGLVLMTMGGVLGAARHAGGCVAGLRVLGGTVAAVAGSGAERSGGAGGQILVIRIVLFVAAGTGHVTLEHFLVRVISRSSAELQADIVQSGRIHVDIAVHSVGGGRVDQQVFQMFNRAVGGNFLGIGGGGVVDDGRRGIKHGAQIVDTAIGVSAARAVTECMLGGGGQSNGIRFYFRLLVRTGGAVMGVGGAVASGIGTDVSFLPGNWCGLLSG